MDIHGGGEPYGEVILFKLRSARGADLADKLGVPCAGEERGAGPCRGGYARLSVQTQACGAVRRRQGRNAEPLEAAESAGVAYAGLILMPADKVDKLVNGELLYKFVERYLLADVVKHDCLLGGACLDRRRFADGVIRLAHGQRLKAAVGNHALAELERAQQPARLPDDDIVLNGVFVAEFFGASDRIAEIEGIFAGLKHICCFLYLAEVVEARHIGDVEAERESFALTGIQQMSFGKGRKLLCGLAEYALGSGVIELHGLLAGHGADILNIDGDDDFAVRLAAKHAAEFKIRV